MKKDEQKDKKGISRRDMLAGLASLPVLGALGYGLFLHTSERNKYKSGLLKGIKPVLPSGIPPLVDGPVLRLGVVGTGGRGMYIMKALGFVLPERIDDWKSRAATDKYWRDYLDEFMAQEQLNVRVTAVCDVFGKNAAQGMAAGSNLYRNGQSGEMAEVPRRYLTYQELCASPDVDAVIVATPDHLHVPVALEAARNGKHVYCEKPLSWTVEETFEARKVVRDTGIVFQLGHQGRQTESYQVAKSLIEQDVIGKISLIEVCTNRNDPNGAWVYDIDPEANENTIDWKQFIGPAPWHDFSLERFFRWRCWWDYSTGLSGDLLTHEYDAVNQIMHVGIPDSATSSGGVYFFKDGRTVPDVLQTTFEWPSRNMTMLYSATLASSRNRGKVFMGHDASMEVSNILQITADRNSDRYAEKIKQGVIPTDTPFFTYVPGQSKVDAVTSATELYFAQRGLLYTYVGGKRYDTTHLHMREWLECIRQNQTPSCNIDEAFQEAMTAHMGTRAFLEGRTMYWDKDKEEISRG